MSRLFIAFALIFSLVPVVYSQPRLVKEHGSSRYRFPESMMKLVVSPDGKRVGALGPSAATVFDLASGQPVWRPSGGGLGNDAFFDLGFGADGGLTILGSFEFGTSLLEFSPIQKQPIRRVAVEQGADYSSVFSPDASLLAVVEEHVIILDARTGKELNVILSPEGETPVKVQFSSDGNRILIEYSPTRIHVYDRVTGNRICEYQSDMPRENATFSRDGKQFTVPIDPNTFETVTIDSGKTKRFKTVESHDLMLGLDSGRVLTVDVGNGYFQVFDTNTGKLLRHFRGTDSLEHIVLTPDGKTIIASTTEGHILLWDLATGRKLPQSADVRSSTQLQFVGKNQLAMVKSRPMLSRAEVYGGSSLEIWNWETGHSRSIRPQALGQFDAVRSELSPDGTRFARSTSTADPRQFSQNLNGVELADSVNGRAVRRMPGSEQLYPSAIWFQNDGREVGVYSSSDVYLWNLSTNRVRKLPLRTAQDAKNNVLAYPIPSNTNWFAERIVEDNKPLGEYRVYNLSRNQMTQRIATAANFGSLQFVPDGTRLVLVTLQQNGGGSFDSQLPYLVSVRNSETGRIERQFSSEVQAVLDLSPDGRIALGEYYDFDSNHTQMGLCGIELATGNIRWKLVATDGFRVESARFSPDNRLVARATSDGKTQVWEFAPKRQRVAPTSKEVEAMWHDLGATESVRAYAAIQRFVQFPELSISFLESRLPVESAIEPKVLEQWLDDLDAPQFRQRDRATKNLALVLPRVRTVLEKTLAKTASVEVRDRIQELLGNTTVPNSVELQSIRAVEILEQIVRNSERDGWERNGATAVLKRWANGADGGTLTVESSRALARVLK